MTDEYDWLEAVENMGEYTVENDDHWNCEYLHTYTLSNGVKIKPSQQAYVSGYGEDVHYTAHAEDDEGNEYEMRWEITNPQFESEEDPCEEQDACEWDTCVARKL